jgi:hypothetical protein
VCIVCVELSSVVAVVGRVVGHVLGIVYYGL